MQPRNPRRLACLTLVLGLVAGLSIAAARQSSVFDQIDLLVDIRHELVDGYVEAPDQQKMIEAAVRGMVESLNDPYTSYLSPDELDPFERYVRGSFSGIGAEIDTSDGRPRIVTPLEDSPAWKAGVLAGDIILEIDGESTQDMTLPDAVKKLTGEEGTQVELLVRHESGEEQRIKITRAVINIQTVRGFRRDSDHHFDYMIDDANKVGYVRITQFSERTAGELRTALDQLKKNGVKALILDLRFNPGGLLQSAVEVSDMFLGAGKKVVSVKGRVVPEQTYEATADDVMPDVPIVVLANEASASAAEIVTGALSDNGRALFVGTRTFGKGSVQQVKMLESSQGALKLTNAYYYIPSGRLIHRREDAEVWGVDPAEGAYVPLTPEQVRTMLEVRRNADVLRDDNGATDAAVTPEWIESELKDPQLAAALRAALGRLQGGEWPQVGRSGKEELIREVKRQNLALRRDLLKERLDEVEKELRDLQAGGPVTADSTDSETAADNGEADLPAAEVSPTDPAKVKERVEEAEQRILQEQAPPASETAPEPAPSEAPAEEPAPMK